MKVTDYLWGLWGLIIIGAAVFAFVMGIKDCLGGGCC